MKCPRARSANTLRIDATIGKRCPKKASASPVHCWIKFRHAFSATPALSLDLSRRGARRTVAKWNTRIE